MPVSASSTSTRPEFRGASLGGAIAGALVAVVAAYFIWGYRRRGRKLHESKSP